MDRFLIHALIHIFFRCLFILLFVLFVLTTYYADKKILIFLQPSPTFLGILNLGTFVIQKILKSLNGFDGLFFISDIGIQTLNRLVEGICALVQLIHQLLRFNPVGNKRFGQCFDALDTIFINCVLRRTDLLAQLADGIFLFFDYLFDSTDL